MMRNRNLKLIIVVITSSAILFMTFLLMRLFSESDKLPISVPTPADITNTQTTANNQAIDDINKSIISPPRPVPILMYHYIRDYQNTSDKIGTALSVSPALFTDHVVKLKNNGYQSISFNNYLYDTDLPSKSIIFTFDDGYSDAYQAASILHNSQMTGTFYVITDFIGRTNYLTLDQIKEMLKWGMTIGSHTLSHPDLAKIADIDDQRQITESRQLLEKMINQPITDFCYPSGSYNQAIVDIVHSAGYLTATTTKSVSAVGFANYLTLPRLRVSPNTTSNSLINMVNNVN